MLLYGAEPGGLKQNTRSGRPERDKTVQNNVKWLPYAVLDSCAVAAPEFAAAGAVPNPGAADSAVLGGAVGTPQPRRIVTASPTMMITEAATIATMAPVGMPESDSTDGSTADALGATVALKPQFGHSTAQSAHHVEQRTIRSYDVARG